MAFDSFAFIPYEDIVRAYKYHYRAKKRYAICVMVITRDGKKHFATNIDTCFKNANESIDMALSEISRRNPNVIIGEE